MKKFSVLIALILCATIGGIYAAWLYPNDNADIYDIHDHFTLGIDIATNSGGDGDFEADPSGVKILIVPQSDSDPALVHKAKIQITGDLVITFKPSLHANNDIKRDGPTGCTWTLGTSVDVTGWKYGDAQIFDVNTTTNNITWVKDNGTGYFTCTITAATLESMITFANEFNLDTKTDHTNFGTALGQGQIGITISDGKVTGSQP